MQMMYNQRTCVHAVVIANELCLFKYVQLNLHFTETNYYFHFVYCISIMSLLHKVNIIPLTDLVSIAFDPSLDIAVT